MKLKSPLLVCLLVVSVICISSCAHRDCQGKKHKIKTNMGGYL